MELDRDQLISLVMQLRDELKNAREELKAGHDRISELEQQLRKQSPDTRLEEGYSLKAEEQRRKKHSGKRRKQQSERRGRRTTQEKLDAADRIQIVCPDGFDVEQCKLHRQRPVWRIEDGRAALVAYHIYRGPSGELPDVPGLLPRSEFGLEILVTLAFEVVIVGLSMDKTIGQLGFFWNLSLSKSQVDSLLNRLARDWEPEFDALCELLAVSAVVHADETSWSINSVWALLSEKARVLVFGCHKDAATLEALLPKDVFEGVLVSDDAAVYRNFSQAQKCWAHLIRKAIKLTLQDPESEPYRRFLDGLLNVYRTAQRIQRDKRFRDAGRAAKIDELDNMLCEFCGDRFMDETEPSTDLEGDYRNLVHEVVRLMGESELFTFVTHPDVDGTNNEAERGLRDSAQARKTGRTSKTIRGARRRTVLTSVLESLRLSLPVFTLSTVVNEVQGWLTAGISRFGVLLQTLGLPPPTGSMLDAVLPLPDIA